MALSLALLHPDWPTPQVMQNEPLSRSSHHWHRSRGNQRPFHWPGSEKGRGQQEGIKDGACLKLHSVAGSAYWTSAVTCSASRCCILLMSGGAVTPKEPNEAPPGPA